MIVTVAVWAALRPDLVALFNLVLLAGLIAVTTIYAYSTIRIARDTKRQADEIREQRLMASRPMIIQRSVRKEGPTVPGPGIRSDYFPHFEIYNAGNGPAIELEFSLLNKERDTLHCKRESFLRAGDTPIEFRPINLANLEESTTYHLACEYQGIFSAASEQAWYQTWLPFEVMKSSIQGEVFVTPGELEFKEVSQKDRINCFSNVGKPK
jgi:hypothetical protein